MIIWVLSIVFVCAAIVFKKRCVVDPVHGRKKRPRIVCVVGNIGAGKTTLMNELAEKRGWDTYLEPTDGWKMFLNLFYMGHAKEVVPVFEFHVLTCLYATLLTAIYKSKSDVVLIERSPRCVNLFLDANARRGVLSKSVARFVVAVSRVFCMQWEPDLYLYLDTPPAVCGERVAKRASTAGDEKIDAEYFDILHAQHNLYYARHKATVRGTADATVDAEAICSRLGI